MKIGILETGHAPDELRPEHGDYADMFVRLLGPHGLAFSRWDVEAGALPDDPAAADGWLITGSRHGVYEPHPWIAPLEAFIRAVHGSGRALVGICFGHQIIARALGGEVRKAPTGWVVGPQLYRFRDGRVLRLNAWHQDQVLTPPPGAVRLAESDNVPHAALLYPERALTLQPHPEFDNAFLEGLARTRGRGVVPEDRLARAQAARDHPPDSARAAEMIAGFLRERRL